MSWFVVGGIAIGATAGAIAGSKKGGDDVWKGALIGGAIGGAGGWAAAPAAAGAAPAAGAALAPEAAGAVGVAGGATPAAGIMGAEAAAIPGIGAASSAPIAGTSATMLPGAATPIAAAAPQAAAGSTGIASIGANAAPIAGTSSATMPGTVSSAFAPGMQAPVQMVQAPAATEYAMFGGDTAPAATEYAMFGGDTAPAATNVATKTPTQSPLEKGFGSAMSWLSEPKNAMFAGVLGLGALSMFNQDNEDNFGGSNVQTAGYPLSPNFKPSRYQPTRTYAAGGIAAAGRQTGMYPQSQMDMTQFATPSQMPTSREIIDADYDATITPYTGDLPRFAKGGDTKSNAMIDPRMKTPQEKAPGWVGRSIADVNDPGIYIDRDEDTMYQDALTAAKTRMGKVAKGANVQLGAMQKPTPMGKLNLGPVAGVEEERKATGGITSLGGYAHGGNPRLLRGPGDGMSDDIPATIADKQPARLADGEFVVPADVVSGLGNGSTEAGAKKLHKMMDKVRVDRTGTKKQGKQIKAEKYIPGMASGGIVAYADGGYVNPNTLFDPEWYLQQNPDVAAAGVDPWQHYQEFGKAEGRAAYPSASGSTTQQSRGSTLAQGYNPDYYNPQYYQSQLDAQRNAVNAAQARITESQKQLEAYKSGQGNQWQSTGDNYNLANLSETAKQNAGLNAYYQQYLGRNIGQDEPFSRSPEGIINSAEARAWAAANAPLAEAQKAIVAEQQKIAPIEQQLARLEQSGIRYDPYTIANRPSSAEPQFYGNIYKPEYENYTRPGYSLSGELGQWSNVAGDTQRYVEGLYNTELGRGSDPEGLRNWTAQLQSGNLDPTQVRQGFWGSQEYRNLHPEHQLPTQMQPNVNQIAAGQAAAQQQSLANAQEAAMHSRNMINASVAAGENKPPQEKQARKGGILAAKR